MAIKNTKRGFALLIAVIFMSVMLTFGLALGSLAYKQQVLASGAVASQYAFYAADAALECALYADQQQNLFTYNPDLGAPAPVMTCDSSAPVSATVLSHTASQWVISTRLSFDSGRRCADVTAYKPITGTNYLFSQGYDVSCATVATPGGARFVSRGLKASYTSSPPPPPPPGSSAIFSLSPSVGGKSTWNLSVDGPLTLSSGGTWTITPSAAYTVTAQTWGAGGGGGGYGPAAGKSGGAGGYAQAGFALASGSNYVVRVGGGGMRGNGNGEENGGSGGSPGGGGDGAGGTGGDGGAGGGGGYTGLFSSSVTFGNAMLMAGGGGGGAYYQAGDNGVQGGGTSGSAGGSSSGKSGGGGSQSSGGSAGSPNGRAGARLTGADAVEVPGGGAGAGGGGGGGYYGGGSGGADDGSDSGGGGGGSGYIRNDGTSPTQNQGGGNAGGGSQQNGTAGKVIISYP